MRRPRPIALFLGPIFQKEVNVAGRRRRTYALRTAYILGLMGIVTLAFLAMSNMVRGGLPVQRLQQLQQLTPMLTTVMIWVQFFVLALVAPILTAGAINEERIKGTLGTLLTTPLTAAQIVCGKLSSRLVQLLVLGMLATPLLLAIRIFGGVQARFVLTGVAIGATTAVLGASLGLAYSNRLRRAAIAALFGFLTLALFQGGPPAAIAIAGIFEQERAATTGRSTRSFTNATTMSVMAATCSPIALSFLSLAESGAPVPTNIEIQLEDSSRGGSRSLNLGPIWIWNCGYNLTIAGVMLLLTIGSLRRRMRREGMGDARLATAGMEEEATPRGKRRKRRKIGARTTSREVSDNPVFWREWRQASFSSPRLTRVVLALTLILLLLLYATVGFSKREVHGTVLFIAVLGVVLQGVFTTSMAFGNERESRTWDVLLTTPLSAWRITFGKFVGVLKALWFFPAIALADLVLAAISGVVSPMLALHAILIMLGPAVLLSSVGTTCGLLFRRGMSAAVATLAVALAIWLLCWPALGVLAGAMRLVDHETTDLIARVLYFINPIAMMMSAVEGAGDIYARNRYEVGEGPGSAYALFEFTRLTIFVLLGYLGVSAGLLALAVSRFNRWAPRTS